jgi:hypothetical protein
MKHARGTPKVCLQHRAMLLRESIQLSIPWGLIAPNRSMAAASYCNRRRVEHPPLSTSDARRMKGSAWHKEWGIHEEQVASVTANQPDGQN